MKSIAKTVLLISVILGLSGCAQANGIAEKYIAERSGVLDSEEYIEYLQNLENGKVDENGYWIIKEETEVPAEGIVVSFVSNNHFDTAYYSDPDFENRLDEGKCYLSPGDTIYAETPKIKNIIDTSYRFDNYEIYCFENGKKVTLDTVSNSEGKIYTIPSDFSGESISICPNGEFLPCNIKLHAYLKTESSKKEIDISWKVDGTDVNGNSISFIPNSDFSIEAAYPNTGVDYYLLESSIVPSYRDDVEGVVRFEHVKADDKNLDYSIVIKEYTAITFNNKKDVISGIDAQAKWNGETLSLKKGSNDLGLFKYGDEIEFTLEKGYTITTNGLYVSRVVESSNGDTFTVKITENSPAEASIGIEKKTTDKVQLSNHIENGVMTVYHSNGTPIVDEETVDLDEKINVIITPNAGYYITGSKVSDNVYSETMKFSDFKKKTDDIISKHKIKKYITVTLDEKDDYGVCAFYIDKNQVSGTITNLKEGDVITLKYTITDSNYKIDRLIGSTKTDEKIKVTESLSNKTIRREDYISIKKKG